MAQLRSLAFGASVDLAKRPNHPPYVIARRRVLGHRRTLAASASWSRNGSAIAARSSRSSAAAWSCRKPTGECGISVSAWSRCSRKSVRSSAASTSLAASSLPRSLTSLTAGVDRPRRPYRTRLKRARQRKFVETRSRNRLVAIARVRRFQQGDGRSRNDACKMKRSAQMSWCRSAGHAGYYVPPVLSASADPCREAASRHLSRGPSW